MRKHLLFLIVPLLAACAQDEFSDLRSFMAQAGQEGKHALDPLPQLALMEEFTFVPGERPDPFKPQLAKSNNAGSGVRPDTTRQKEYLEGFPLDSLRMVGTLEQGGQRYALIKTPDGALSRVKKGNFLGQNYGLIIAISDSVVEVNETIQDGAGDWVESKAMLALQE